MPHLALFLALAPSATANDDGKTGRSVSGCSCHSATASTGTSASFSASATTVLPGDAVSVQFIVASTSSLRTHAGLDVSATGGTLAAGSNNQQLSGEITHLSPQALSGGTISFDFSWTAPTAEGTYSLRGVGNTVNNNGRDTGDAWNNAADISIVVDDGCDDTDGDGFEVCNDGSGTDCDDSDANIYPLADEFCGGIDYDCDGLSNEASSLDIAQWFMDADGDSFGDFGGSLAACEQPIGYAANDTDCDDSDGDAYPGAAEQCDTTDQDCSGALDLALACGEECGDGTVVGTLPGSTAAACTSFTTWTNVRTLTQLLTWAANPTRGANISAAIDAGGADITLITNCDVRATSTGSLTNLGNLEVFARNITLGAPVTATGDVLLRASTKAYLTSAATVTAASFTAEGGMVDVRADNTSGGAFCGEADTLSVGTDTAWDLGGAEGVLSAVTTLDLVGDMSNGSWLDLASAGALYQRSASTVSSVSGLFVSSANTADMSGRVEFADELTLDALTLTVGSSSGWASVSAVSVAATGTSTTSFQGDVTNGGGVDLFSTGYFSFSVNALISGNGDVNIDAAGRFDGRGSVTGNGVVDIDSGSWKLGSAHDFSGNTACTLSGTAVSGTAVPLGCTAI